MAKGSSVLIEEMRSLRPYYLGINAVYFTIIIVLFFAFNYDYSLIIGAVWGNLICVANFWLLGRSAEKAVRYRKSKSAQTFMNVSYCLRYLGIFVTMSVAGLVPFISLAAAAVPLFFTRIAILIREIWESRREAVKKRSTAESAGSR